MSKIDSYYYVRFRWWTRVNLPKVEKELAQMFDVKTIAMPSSEMELSLFKDERNELEVKADTLMVRLSPFRAVLAQKEPKPFTKRDAELRSRVLELYPHSRSTPFPWLFGEEPKFEIAEKD